MFDLGRQLRWLLVLVVIGSAAESQTPAQVEAVKQHAEAAHRDLTEKRPELAIPEFRAVLAAEPGNLDAQANLGVLLYFRGDNAGAVPLLQKAVAQKPDLSKIRALLGLAEKAVGQAKAAQADLEAAVPQLTEVPIEVQAGLALIELDEAAQQPEKAAATVALLRQAAPTDPRVLYAAYRIYTDQAGEAMLSLSLAGPESAQMHQAMAHELERARDQAGAIGNLRKAAELDGKLPGIHYELAEALRSADEPKLRAEAESQYRLALEENPQDARSAAALGDVETERADLGAAKGMYERALELDPQLAEASLGLAYVEAEKGDTGGAVALLEKVAAADPTNTLAHFRLSALYRKQGRPADAKRELALYQRYKEMRERLRTIYKAMRQESPDDDASAKAGAK